MNAFMPIRASKATRAKTAVRNVPLNGIIELKGRDKAQREGAYMSIAPLSFVESLSRAECVNNMRVALGKTPSAKDIEAARAEHIIGKVALKSAGADNAAKLERARVIVFQYASAPKDGTTPRALRKGQTGRRSPAEQKAYNAGKEQFSQLLAELGLGAAKTQSEKNKAKRAPAMTGTTARGKVGADTANAKPTHAELVKAPAPVDRETAIAHVMAQASALQLYANKYAKLLPTDIGQAVGAFKASMNKALNAEGERQALRAIVIK